MTSPRHIVGIDLGTTHCAIASAPLSHPRLDLLAVPQLVAPGEVSESPLLPSFAYLPAPGEMTSDERALPWDQDQPSNRSEQVVGEYARRRGAKAPSRLVVSAKSWVCHGGVNRRAAILPWSAPDSEPHISPFDAQVLYLRHLRHVWEAKYKLTLSEQEVVVTVPASFDEGARSLTTDAASEAGLGEVRLLEEPQAAFYDYLGTTEDESDDNDALSAQLADAKLILVVDIGGGTTDLTLLRVLPEDDAEVGRPRIDRIAVGGHLMLGGDNMDAALAVHALDKAGVARPDDASIWAALVQSARQAKERLLSADAPEEAVISYQGRGSRLLGNTKSIVISRDDAVRIVLDGCFPLTGPDDVAQRSARAGLTTLGLPYSNDTAVTRHVCSFLRRHAHAALEAGATVQDGLPRPDLLLLNGGVFKAPAAIERLSAALEGWYGQPVRQLEHTSLDTAVARGAVRSGLARHGLASAIGGGTAKAYYIGIEQGGQQKALCVAPRNVDEGSRTVVPDRVFELLLNEPVAFPLFAYSGDRVDAPGELIEPGQSADALECLPPLTTLLRGRKGAKAREKSVQVTLESTLDEAGALQLHLVSLELPPTRWKLEFVVRGDAASADALSATDTATTGSAAQPEQDEQTSDAMKNTETSEKTKPVHKKTPQAARRLEQAFASWDENDAKGVRRELEEILGPRGKWSASTCRALFDTLLGLVSLRERSELHELNWMRLCSWTVRPGFGSPGDAERVNALWELRDAGLVFPTKTNWAEWWILWRRIAPALDGARQLALVEDVTPWLWPKGKAPAGPAKHGPIEMMRLLAALERVPPKTKAKAGELFLQRIKKLGSYWPLGRVGARSPFHGEVTQVVATDVAEAWLGKLLDLDWENAEGAAFAAVSLARLTGDSRRDVSAALRTEVSERLIQEGASANWIDMVLRNTELAEGDVGRLLGDSLPAGLRLS